MRASLRRAPHRQAMSAPEMMTMISMYQRKYSASVEFAKAWMLSMS